MNEKTIIKKNKKSLIDLFLKSNETFIEKHGKLFVSDVSERCLCNSLSQILNQNIQNSSLDSYYVDSEYNRDKNHDPKIIYPRNKPIKITCDLLVHSRGEKTKNDNLIAIEMKKQYRAKKDKESDKERLKILTKKDCISPVNGEKIPKSVCGYILGIYYEISYKKKEIYLEYYANGKPFGEDRISINN